MNVQLTPDTLSKYTLKDGKYWFTADVNFPSFSAQSTVSFLESYKDRFNVVEIAEKRLVIELLTKFLHNYISWEFETDEQRNTLVNDIILLLTCKSSVIKEQLSVIYD